jgi:hypothetical protein
MRRNEAMRFLFLCLFIAVVAAPAVAKDAPAAARADWSLNATIIEACSCPMFCQCYFSTKPAAHSEHGGHGGEDHFCRFNNAFKVNKGHHGSTKLDGAKFWVYGDLGSEFDDGEMDWAVLAFDKSTTPAQREAISNMLAHVYPVKWKSFSVSEGTIEWVAGTAASHAKLDGGKTAEVALTTESLQRNNGKEAMVLNNLRYWGVPRNDGFVLMPNTVVAVRAGDRPFEYRGTNGFMITIDMNSKDVMAASTGAHGH